MKRIIAALRNAPDCKFGNVHLTDSRGNLVSCDQCRLAIF